jgi:3-isopropylmalate dehydratase small subunit
MNQAETDLRVCDELRFNAGVIAVALTESMFVAVSTHVSAGEDVTVDMEANVLINHTTGKEYQLKPLGDVSVAHAAAAAASAAAGNV